MAKEKQYSVIQAFELDGRVMKPGATVVLGGRQAKYLELNGKIRQRIVAKPKKKATKRRGSK